MQQIAVRGVQLDGIEAEPLGASCGCDKSVATRSKPGVSSASDASSPSLCGTADGASVCQPPW